MRGVGLLLALLALGCGGRSAQRPSGNDAGGGAGSVAGADASGAANSGGRGGKGGAGTQGGFEPGGGAADGGALERGGTPEQGGAPVVGEAGEGGAGGAPEEQVLPDVDELLGDFDLFLEPPPAVAGCDVEWYEPRINLAVERTQGGVPMAQAYQDFFWTSIAGQEPVLTPTSCELEAMEDWRGLMLPQLTLDCHAGGFLGTGTAELRYRCTDGSSTSRLVQVLLKSDATSPRLRAEPVGHGVFGFTCFAFTFSEPLELPYEAYDVTFRELADGEQFVQMYDTASRAPLADTWKFALGGPQAQLCFVDPASVEGREIAPRLIGPLADRAGNPLEVPEQSFAVEPSALLASELDFDDGEPLGLVGNASYLTAPSSLCETGNCVLLEGPVSTCNEAPASQLAVRLAAPWDEAVTVRARVWADRSTVLPLGVSFASGCSGGLGSLTLQPLVQADGTFSHASDWHEWSVLPCGGPEQETGFSISLDCVELGSPPQMRLVLERITRP